MPNIWVFVSRGTCIGGAFGAAVAWMIWAAAVKLRGG